MSLHRLLGFDAAVPDPSALASYYDELGLTGDATSGYSGSDGGATVRIDEGPFRRLLAVAVGCDDERDLDAVATRLADGGAAVRRDGTSVAAEGRTPLGLAHVANAWGPNLPTEFVVPDDLGVLEAGWARLAT